MKRSSFDYIELLFFECMPISIGFMLEFYCFSLRLIIYCVLPAPSGVWPISLGDVSLADAIFDELYIKLFLIALFLLAIPLLPR